MLNYNYSIMAKLTKSQKRKVAIIITCTVLVVATTVIIASVFLPPAAPPLAVGGALIGTMVAGEIIKLVISHGGEELLSKTKSHHKHHASAHGKPRHDVKFNNNLIVHSYDQCRHDGDFIKPEGPIDPDEPDDRPFNHLDKP